MAHEVRQELRSVAMEQCAEGTSDGIRPGTIIYVWLGTSSR